MKARIPYALMLELEELFPPRCIGPSESLREADRYAGKVELVALLRNNFNSQVPDVPTEAPTDVDPETGVRTYDQLYGDLGDEP